MANIIDMPKLSDTMTVGTLVKWLKNEGAAVKSGDMLAEIETDKATMELESFFDGTLLKQFAKAGDQVAIGAPLCAVGAPGEKVSTPVPAQTEPAPQPAAAAAPARPAAPVSTPANPPAAAALPSSASRDPQPDARVKISPLAKRIAAEKGVDYAHLSGSGPGGRIVKADILAAEKNPPALSAVRPAFAGGPPARTGPIAEDKLTPVSSMRATIARRLLEAKTQIPHFYLEIEVDAAPLLELRAQLNGALESAGVKLSVNDFILKASAEALRRVPAVNCSWENNAIRQHGSAHVSFAVAIDDGLITPVIRDTHAKTIFQISTEAKALGKRAREKKLKPDEFTGGTFCVSNLGMMGVDKFSAIINPPNAVILAVGATVKKPVVKDERIVIGQRLTLTLSCDHRVVDGALGATYLAALRELLEKPALLLI